MADIQNVLSVCLFALFVVMVLIRAMIMHKRDIRVIVFGQTDKSDFLLVPPVLAIAYSVLASTFGFPFWNVLIQPFWRSTAPGWVGLVLCILSAVGVALTLANFGNSFRVGIDENTPDKLVTRGMFAVSRNPIYISFLVFLTGLFLIHRNVVVALGIMLFAPAMHRQILREEKFLRLHYGDKYEAYCKKVRRYI